MLDEHMIALLDRMGISQKDFGQARENTVLFLEKGGLNPEKFDRLGAKNINDLALEQLVRETRLVMLGPKKGSTLRHSSKLGIQTPDEVLVEEFRVVKGKKVVREIGAFPGLSIPQGHSFSEGAVMEGESPQKTIYRCFGQELGVDVDNPEACPAEAPVRQFVPEHCLKEISRTSIELVNVWGPVIERYMSSVFWRLRTMNITTWFALEFSERIGPDRLIIPDGEDTLNHLVWQPRHFS